MALPEASVSRDQLHYRDPENPSLPTEYSTIAFFVAQGFREAGIEAVIETELTPQHEIKISIDPQFSGDFLSAVQDIDRKSHEARHPSNENPPFDLQNHLIDEAKKYGEAMIAKQEELKTLETVE